MAKQIKISNSITCPNSDCCGCLIEKEQLGDIECNECNKQYIVINPDMIKALIDKASANICEAQMDKTKFDSLSLARQKLNAAMKLCN